MLSEILRNPRDFLNLLPNWIQQPDQNNLCLLIFCLVFLFGFAKATTELDQTTSSKHLLLTEFLAVFFWVFSSLGFEDEVPDDTSFQVVQDALEGYIIEDSDSEGFLEDKVHDEEAFRGVHFRASRTPSKDTLSKIQNLRDFLRIKCPTIYFFLEHPGCPRRG